VVVTDSSSCDGGAVYCYFAAPVITNCVFAGNAADEYGGAIRSAASDITMRHCTIAGNSAMDGTALACRSPDSAFPSTIDMSDCVLWDSGNEVHNNDGSSITIRYSDVRGGWVGEGNIDADPLFVTGPLGRFYLSQTAAGEPADSPCVDAGSDLAQSFGLDAMTTRTDQVGDAGIVDMGYHYAVDCSGDLDGDRDTDQSDLGILLASWGIDAGGDLNGDGETNQSDLGILLSDWGCGA